MRVLTAVVGVLVALMTGQAVAGCNAQQQKDCLEIRVLSAKFDATRHADLTKPPATEAERVKRVLGTGGQIWSGYRSGIEQASKPKAFYYFVWGGATPIQNTDVSAYRVNGRDHQVAKIGLEDVTEQMKDRVTIDQTATPTGPVMKVYRVTTVGNEAIGASIQLPWAVIGANTRVLICPEEKLAMYPNRQGEADEGIWLTPQMLDLARKAGATRGLVAVLSKDGP